MGRSALLIVDVQNDFCPGGALPAPRGHEVVPVLNRCISICKDLGLPIFASRDWHPPNSKHFEEGGGRWPPHCVQGTKGAEFHVDLRLPREAVVVTKGADPEEDAYSVFQGVDERGKPFEDVLRTLDVERLFVGGLATDYCVLSSVLDARKRGLDVVVLTDAIRAVDVRPGDGETALKRMVEAGARPGTSEDVRKVLGSEA